MGWNYRMVRTWRYDIVEKRDIPTIELTEVYYHDDTDDEPRAYVVEMRGPSAEDDPEGDPLGDLKWTLEAMQEGLRKPVLDSREDFVWKEETDGKPPTK